LVLVNILNILFLNGFEQLSFEAEIATNSLSVFDKFLGKMNVFFRFPCGIKKSLTNQKNVKTGKNCMDELYYKV
jgi:hypothetical protein